MRYRVQQPAAATTSDSIPAQRRCCVYAYINANKPSPFRFSCNAITGNGVLGLLVVAWVQCIASALYHQEGRCRTPRRFRHPPPLAQHPVGQSEVYDCSLYGLLGATCSSLHFLRLLLQQYISLFTLTRSSKRLSGPHTEVAVLLLTCSILSSYCRCLPPFREPYRFCPFGGSQIPDSPRASRQSSPQANCKCVAPRFRSACWIFQDE